MKLFTSICHRSNWRRASVGTHNLTAAALRDTFFIFISFVLIWLSIMWYSNKLCQYIMKSISLFSHAGLRRKPLAFLSQSLPDPSHTGLYCLLCNAHTPPEGIASLSNKANLINILSYFYFALSLIWTSLHAVSNLRHESQNFITG